MLQQRIRLAIADHNQSDRIGMKNYFEKVGDFEITGVLQDGESLIEHLKKEKPDVLVMDVILPRLDGIGVLQRFEELGDYRPKVIAASDMGTHKMTRRVLDLGADYYLEKPVSGSLLERRIREELEPKQEARCYDAEGPADNARVQKAIMKILHDVGMPAHVKGYLFVKEGIQMILSNVELIGCITKEIYPVIAEKFNTTPTRVERAIRHAIELSWDRGNLDYLHGVFGYTINARKGKPTNSEFMAMIADRLRADLNLL